MSVGIQRAEDKYNSKGGYYDIDDDEEEDVVMREAAQEEVQISPASFDGFFNLETLPMWTHKRPPGMLGEGDNLPSMDEVAKEGARAAHLAESKSNYFEHPFETAVAPWDQQGATKVSTALVPVNGRPISTPRDLFGPLTVSIRDVDESNTFYLIDLQYGEIKWTVKRNVVDFYDLWVTLKLRSTIKSPPSFPSKVQNFAHAIASLRSAHEQNSIMIHSELTSLDTRNEKRRLELAQYLQELVEKSQKVEDLTGLTDLCEFLEVSGISIVKDMGWKGKEGYLEQKVVTRSAPVLRPIRRYGWVKKWFILRDSYIAFCKDTSSTTPTDVMLLDKEFKYHTSERKQFSSHSVITLAKGSKSIQIRVQKGVDEWLDNLNTVKLKSPWVSQQRFNSFAPIRENAKVKWFVDGHEYFEAVAEAILSAKSDIFIEDWWLSPQLYLRRPPKGNEDYRIDRLLKRKASLDDVKIYIVIYKSMKVALPLNSGHTKHWLQDAHPNIIVQRHSNITEAPFWAHHEWFMICWTLEKIISVVDL
ncbi:hypothetical protein BDB00DRAFT_785778 [Zychaea mexicana]|uniref:uncharacterized protein n=1 Tax=Zychaea mexicana TaxID=64656 RepID=UPI0022FF3C96|nr:uncharacterized protein BDB00DRAFT_785778 [Zychaea mexicana]KAI9496366.1 hypothetical protein BDB00DRAFT_785778 [Zychaea mexicana]